MSRAKNKKKVNNLSRYVLSVKNKSSWVQRYHKCLNYDEIERLIGRVSIFPEFSEQINLSLNSNFSLFYNVNLPLSDLRVNLAWCVGVVTHHEKRIKKFRKLEEKLEEQILIENYEASIEILDEIDRECGLSTWSIGIRGSILKISGEEVKYFKLISDLNNNKGYSDFFKVLLKYIVDRYDENNIHTSLADTFRKQIMRFPDDEFKSFLLYKITPKDYLLDFEINYNGVLKYEKQSSIIDIYKALISYIESSTKNHAFDANLPYHIKNVIIKLNKICYHPIVNNCLNFYSLNPEKPSFNFELPVLDLYTQGKYEEIARSIYVNKPLKYIEFEILSKSISRLPSNFPFVFDEGILGKILRYMTSILLKKEDYSSAFSSLLTYCYAFDGISWFQELLLFVSRESKFIGRNKFKSLSKIAALKSKDDTPQKLLYLHGKNKEYFVKYLQQNCIKSTTANFFLDLYEYKNTNHNSLLVTVDKHRLKKHEAIIYFSQGNQDQAIQILKESIKDSKGLDFYDILKLLVDMNFEAGYIEQAITIVVEYVLKDKNNILIFDIDKVAYHARDLVSSSNSINIPISLSLYCKYSDDRYRPALRASFDNFITKNNLKSPIELLENNLGYSDEKIDYFLEYVCTINNMKLSMLFEDKQEIDLCRIKICNELIEKGISRDSLVEEIKHITKEEVFRKAAAQVDQSRIYVDITLFKDTVFKNFKDLFVRFTDLKKQNYTGFNDEFILTFINSLVKDKETQEVFELSQKITLLTFGNSIVLNEKNKIFYNLIKTLRDEFTFGDKGLNSYLSTRIRHGVLPTALRKPVQNESLWATSDLHTGEIKENKLWVSKLKSITDTSELSKHLYNFTIEYEKIINEINDSWLQIRCLERAISSIQVDSDENKVLFDYSLSEYESLYIQALVGDRDYNHLIDITLEWLWYKTDINLSNVREAIENKSLNKFDELFTQLDKNVALICTNQDEASLFSSSVRKSRESLNTQLTNISSWFKRSLVNHVDEFEINTAIEIAKRATNVNISLKQTGNHKFKSRYLSSFVDIFYIIFENALSKSKLSTNQLLIKVEISSQNDDLILSFINNSLSVDYIAKNQELDKYRVAYNNPELMVAASQKEGGTGIFKICNIIEKEFKIEHINTFGYKDNETYHNEIILKEVLKVISI
ncbi:hypothetical protein [Wohlfahrtiimonas populi]|uniref:hypothetical protein n=1 Tax=Wohlfahrtiimonas populi TaxID=1940240 RepID=UPI00117E972C|nr:hypothetical protein [Wohlfahrtiimonas populi]